MNKNCVITIESSERTRWLYSPLEFQRAVAYVVNSVVKAHTSGPEPKVSIQIEGDEQLCPKCNGYQVRNGISKPHCFCAEP